MSLTLVSPTPVSALTELVSHSQEVEDSPVPTSSWHWPWQLAGVLVCLNKKTKQKIISCVIEQFYQMQCLSINTNTQ